MVVAVVTQNFPDIPKTVSWRNGMVLEPDHFLRTDARSAGLAHLAGLIADPWPWGFLTANVDQIALAAGELKVECEGVFPDGTPFERSRLAVGVGAGEDGENAYFELAPNPRTGAAVLQRGSEAPSGNSLPVARLARRGGAWNMEPGWSPPALLLEPEHPMRADINRALGGLAAIGVGFITTLRMPGAENRPVARVLGQVAVTISQGVGVMEALLAAPVVTPGRLGLEALRLTLGVRTAAGIFEPMDGAWSQHDQRGSMRLLLGAATSAASGVGLPFRTNVFQAIPGSPGVLRVDVVAGRLLLAIEASRPADLAAARHWFDGAALTAPDRIQEALSRRVAGCRRRPVERDAALGVSSGPLLALYEVEDDFAWRAGKLELALSAESPPPMNSSFSILVPEGGAVPAPEALPAPGSSHFGTARSGGS